MSLFLKKEVEYPFNYKLKNGGDQEKRINENHKGLMNRNKYKANITRDRRKL